MPLLQTYWVGSIYALQIHFTQMDACILLTTLRKDFVIYSCIGGCLVSQNTVADMWSNAW